MPAVFSIRGVICARRHHRLPPVTGRSGELQNTPERAVPWPRAWPVPTRRPPGCHLYQAAAAVCGRPAACVTSYHQPCERPVTVCLPRPPAGGGGVGPERGTVPCPAVVTDDGGGGDGPVMTARDGREPAALSGQTTDSERTARQ